jgi:hypothetical protein
MTSRDVDGSLDGENLVLIDQRTANNDRSQGKGTKDHTDNSFTVSNAVETRFVRVTQTARDCGGNQCLGCVRFEVFGALFA